MSHPRISIVDYGMGNIWSVSSALKYLNATSEVVSDPDEIISAECIILPGVGSFREAMLTIREKNIDQALLESSKKGTKILGICLGMQLLGASSDEDGFTEGLNFFQRKVELFPREVQRNLKLPHIGFNSVNFHNDSKLYKNLEGQDDFYFVHSYRMLVKPEDVSHGTCFYGQEFLASFEHENIYGTQFHPEKSQTNGIKLLQNFLEI